MPIGCVTGRFPQYSFFVPCGSQLELEHRFFIMRKYVKCTAVAVFVLPVCTYAFTVCARIRALNPASAPALCSRIHANSSWGAAMADSDDDYDARKLSFICDEEDEARTQLCLPNASGRFNGMPTEPWDHHRERLVLPYVKHVRGCTRSKKTSHEGVEPPSCPGEIERSFTRTGRGDSGGQARAQGERARQIHLLMPLAADATCH